MDSKALFLVTQLKQVMRNMIDASYIIIELGKYIVVDKIRTIWLPIKNTLINLKNKVINEYIRRKGAMRCPAISKAYIKYDPHPLRLSDPVFYTGETFHMQYAFEILGYKLERMVIVCRCCQGKVNRITNHITNV